MQALQSTTEKTFDAIEPAIAAHGRMLRLVRMASSGVGVADLAALAAMIAETGGFSRQELDALVAIEASPSPKCDDWAAFFIDAVTDGMVWQARPSGVVNESQGEWLIAMADRCGTQAALGALANVAAEAHRLPLWFVAAVRARLARCGAQADIARVA